MNRNATRQKTPRPRRVAGLATWFAGMVVCACLASMASAFGDGAESPRAEGYVVELRGGVGDTVRIEVPGFCIEYGKPGPQEHTTLSADPQAGQQELVRLLQLARALRDDPWARYMLLMQSPVYAEVLRHHQLQMWIAESDVAAAALHADSDIGERYAACQLLAEALLSEEALEMVTQRAVWAMTSGVTAEQLHEDALRAATTPEERLAVDLEMQLFAPYVEMLLRETGTHQTWGFPEGGWLPPVQDAVAYPVLEVLLPFVPVPRVLEAAAESMRTYRWAAAAFYYEQVLRQPHHPALSGYLCWQLAYAYDRLSQQQPSPDTEQSRRHVQAVLADLARPGSDALTEPPDPGAPAPDLTELPREDVHARLAAAQRALARGDYLRCAQAALPALDIGAAGPDACHALRMFAHASMFMGEVGDARQALARLLETADGLSPDMKAVFGIEEMVREAEILLLRIDAQEEFDTSYYAARDRRTRGDLRGAVERLEEAAAVLPGSRKAHLLLADLYERLGDDEQAQRERFRAGTRE